MSASHEHITGRRTGAAALVFLVGLAASLVPCTPCLGQPDYTGLVADDCAAVLDQICPEAPVVLLQYLPDLLPGRMAIVVGTTLYRALDGGVHAAKLSVFAKNASGWDLFFETDMDERVLAQGLPSDWEIGLARVEAVDLDVDRLKELVVWWISEPQDGFSLVHYGSILHVLHYDPESASLQEITDDAIVCNQYTERAMLLNVDRDDADEIVVLNEIWEPDTCVMCSKRYRIDVWTVVAGELVRDPAWNNGQPFETESQFSLLDCNQGWRAEPSKCDLGELLRLVLTQSR